ncbi:hypothetical protein [Methylocystis heyeri]|uniref:Uncharacterized protein n=1 Tax=Methylocystis heyeri TaxID=391905 RepID=A0A6B8KFP6_9HYPH|nr:hypothetical protein [Methylocystis heyeri]QGM46547.1 hypothetical protein H2LOC_013060 [Methylocystis heyeri]
MDIRDPGPQFRKIRQLMILLPQAFGRDKPEFAMFSCELTAFPLLEIPLPGAFSDRGVATSAALPPDSISKPRQLLRKAL